MPEVTKVAMDSGKAKYPINDWDEYKKVLDKRISEHVKNIAKCGEIMSRL